MNITIVTTVYIILAELSILSIYAVQGIIAHIGQIPYCTV